jgi:hypothetical protein
MKKITVLTTVLFLLIPAISGFTPEQDKSIIRGRVSDENGFGLQGAGIVIDGTYLGVYAGMDGYYQFTGLKNGEYLLHFSFVGFKTAQVNVTLNDTEILNVSLESEPIMTQEVVITSTPWDNKRT